jgi:signal transduction histidine kinase
MPQGLSNAGADGGTLACLYRLGNLVNSTEDPGEALELLLDEVVRVFGASSAAVSLLNPDTGGLRIEVSRGHDGTALGFELPPGRGITGWVAMHNRPLLVPDTAKDPRYVHIKPGVRSELAVPMEIRGNVIGVVNCDSDRPGAFSEAHARLLALITAEAAKIVGRLWLLRQFKAQAAQLETIVAATHSLVHERDLPGVFGDLARHTRALAQCRATAVYAVENDGGRMLRLAAVDGPLAPARLTPVLSPLDTALGVPATRARQVEIHNAGRGEDHLFEQLDDTMAAASILATPVHYDGEVSGVLLVMHGGPHRYSNDEKRLASTIAAIGASAAQNARLYARLFANEEDLRRGERLTTLGMLAAEIAHEVRNPLTVIKLLFDTLGLRFPDGDARGEDIRVIREKLSHLETVVGRVLDYGRLQTQTFAPVELSTAILETLQMMRLKLEQCRVRATLVRAPWDAPAASSEAHAPPSGAAFAPASGPVPALPQAFWLEGDKGQVQQVLLNLFLNAIHAMPEGGEIRLALGRVPGPPPRIRLLVADTGGGIPSELRARAFDSFLTATKGGTGLGLAIVKRIMRNHHGDISLESTSSSGTTFSLWFPAIPAPRHPA